MTTPTKAENPSANRPADDGLVAAVRSTTDRHRWAERDDLPSTVVNTKFLGIILTALRAQSDAEVERETIRIQARKDAINAAAAAIRALGEQS